MQPQLTTSRLRVLLAFDWYLKLVVDGQALALREAGHDVTIVCRDHAQEFGGDHAERAKQLDLLRGAGIVVHELPGRRFDPATFGAVRAAASEIARWCPDVASAHENTDPRLLWIVRRYPLVYTVHDPQPHPGAVPQMLRERVAGALWPVVADRLVVHGRGLVGQLPRRLRRRRVDVIPLGIEFAASPHPAPPVPTVLLQGRLQRYKGIDVLFDAMELLWRDWPDIRVIVAGEGPAASDVPVGDPRVELRSGYISEEEFVGLLDRASVSVLPYVQASQSAVGLLSLSRGVPIVVTRVGALPDLLADPNEAVPPGDPVSLAAAIKAALDLGPEQRHVLLESARARLSWQVVADRYVQLYRELLE